MIVDRRTGEVLCQRVSCLETIFGEVYEVFWCPVKCEEEAQRGNRDCPLYVEEEERGKIKIIDALKVVGGNE